MVAAFLILARRSRSRRRAMSPEDIEEQRRVDHENRREHYRAKYDAAIARTGVYGRL